MLIADVWSVWFARPVPFAVFWIVPLHDALLVTSGPHGAPPSTTIQLLPDKLSAPVMGKTAFDIPAPVSKKMVIGLPLDPDPCAVSALVSVPHNFRVLPAVQLPAVREPIAVVACVPSTPQETEPPDWDTKTVAAKDGMQNIAATIVP